MSKLTHSNWIKSAISLLTLILVLSFAPVSQAQSPDKVTTLKDANGWKLQVNGKDHFVKGVVWGYTPIGENYAYNLWGKPEEHIKKVLDYECTLMKAAGINTIRSFSMIPPKWVTYIYQEHGIMTIINHLAGRYGETINGVWTPVIDYSDAPTRAALKEKIAEMVRTYKDTPGILMFALGNESNYGLEWSASFEIENLPVGEQHKEKAKFLYSLFNEMIEEGKKIDQNHLFTIVNGDIQYIDLIKEYCTDLDVLGVNSYRGISFTDLWENVKEKVDLPVLFMEFGSDAYNAVTAAEDQAAQAQLLKGQWQEIYRKSYGNGEEGNAIGGFVFEWRDEWWKFEQTEDLSIHNRHASWENGGGAFDHVEGENNMNEEWFGIMQLGQPDENGVAQAYPRMAYYVLQEIWANDPYALDRAEIDTNIANINMQELELEADVRSLKQTKKKLNSFFLAGGSLRTEFLVNGKQNDVDENGKDALNFTNNEMLFLDFGFRPSSKLSGDFTLNLIADVPQRTLEIVYGHDRDQNSIEIYDFNVELKQKQFDLTAFYHVSRYHWGYEGDVYGLLWEATDIEGIDIWGQKAPFGVEITGKKSLEGLKVVFGPEIYWGANPKIMAKYNFGNDHFKYTLIHSEDLDQASDSSGGADATERATRATTFSVETDIIPGTKIELGAISAGSEKIDDEYTYLDGNDIVYDEIDFEDTLGAKAKITYDGADFGLIYAAASYAGLVADGGDPLREFDTELPYSQYGNKVEVEGGVGIFLGDYIIFPRVLWRENLEDANPIIDPVTTGTELFPGLNPRNRGDDPFAVLDNREALSGEIFFTYDPTPLTDFYHWDNDNREDAPFAMNIGFNYTEYSTPTDSYQFFYQEGNFNAAFGQGLVEKDVWKAISRIVINTESDMKFVNHLEAGFQQSDGGAGSTRKYYSLEFDIDVRDRHTLAGYIKKDQWGPYDFFRQFNVTYPWQFKLDYMYKLHHLLQKYVADRLGRSAGIGVMGLYKTLDENSPKDEYENGDNDYIFEVGTYLSFEF